MKETLIAGVLDWASQKADFERDGSLRDIYVQDATVEDWKIVVAHILDGDYRARLQCGEVVVPMPSDFEAVFGSKLDGSGLHSMSFTVGDVSLACHFFMETEIEFSFEPSDVTETSLRGLLGLMVDVGELTSKSVILTPENIPRFPIFKYDFNEHQLRWIAPPSSRP